MTLAVLWIEYTLGFIQITLLQQEKCPWNSVEMFSMTLVVRWTNSTHWFSLITLLLQKNVLGTQWRCVESLWWCFVPNVPMGSF